MADRFGLRYFAQKLALGVRETVWQLPNSSSVTAALTKGIEAYRKEVTSVIYLAGAAMAPTLNPAALSSSASGLVDRLLVRNILRPSSSSIFVGDVLAFRSPIASPSSDQHSVLVRRVAALEGEELVTDDPEVQPVTIPEGHCWVLADNEQLKPPDVIDSRSFGPLPLQNVVGRIMYFYRSQTDYGIVENSPEATNFDEAILEAELDLEKFHKEQ